MEKLVKEALKYACEMAKEKQHTDIIGIDCFHEKGRLTAGVSLLDQLGAFDHVQVNCFEMLKEPEKLGFDPSKIRLLSFSYEKDMDKEAYSIQLYYEGKKK